VESTAVVVLAVAASGAGLLLEKLLIFFAITVGLVSVKIRSRTLLKSAGIVLLRLSTPDHHEEEESSRYYEMFGELRVVISKNYIPNYCVPCPEQSFRLSMSVKPCAQY
jgi:hypothetical protein